MWPDNCDDASNHMNPIVTRPYSGRVNILQKIANLEAHNELVVWLMAILANTFSVEGKGGTKYRH